jgi:hypothetical protein
MYFRLLRSKVQCRRCAIKVPPGLCASGTLTRSRSVHSGVSGEKPSKRTKEVSAESRAETGVEEPAIEARIKARVKEPAVEVRIKPAVEAGAEKPAVEAGAGEPAVEAGAEPASEARHDHSGDARADRARKTASEALGVKLARSPQYHQEC